MNERERSMSEQDLEQAFQHAIDLSRQAGDTLNSLFGTEMTSERKDGVDFKTEVDDKVDKFLINGILEKFPNAKLLTEESAVKEYPSGDYSSLLHENNVWVIDPLDGTTNFFRGNQNFSVSIALVDKGVPVFGVVNVPQLNRLYTASMYMPDALLNGNPIKVSQIDNLPEAVFGCDWSWNMDKRRDVYTWLKKVYPQVRAIKTMGSAAADLSSLGKGELDVYMHAGLKPWDIAGGALVIQKAGGKITTPQGNLWNVFEPDILATNGAIHQKALDLLNAA